MPYIPTEPVESSNIQAIGYDRKHQGGTLRIIFKENRVYDYPEFPERDWQKFEAAESLGKHFLKYIRPMYGHRTITREQELTPPCCDHADTPTCSAACHPGKQCQPWCCPLGQTSASVPHAIASGLKAGERLMRQAKEGGTSVQAPEDETTPELETEAREEDDGK